MKQIKYFSLPIIVLLLSLSHQSCIDELDMQMNGSDTYVIDAVLINPDSTHYVDIYMANEAPIDTNAVISIKLSDNKGDVQMFKEKEEEPSPWYYYNEEKKYRTFFISNYKLEIGREYTLSVTIDGQEYTATEKLLPPIEVTKLKYKKTKRFKSIEEGYHTLEIPVFSLINPSKENKYYIAALGGLSSGSIRVFSTENMNDTIEELQLSEYIYEPAYEGRNNPDDWYIDSTIGGHFGGYFYGFYPISKANYDYYKTIEKQVRTDGGIYNPNAATPISNFTGGKIYGQFIVTSESYIRGKGGY
ncbi:MAG: DUF4249 family protein [Bacteroidales bacterium]|nr:DUF4249 family protein [Bacteroidales bacterium]